MEHAAARKQIFTRIPSTLGSKGQNTTISEHDHVAYQIKRNDECSNIQAHSLSLHTSSTFWVKGSKHLFFLKEVMLHIKFKGIEHKIPWKQFFCPYTHPRPLEWGQKVKTFFSESSYRHWAIMAYSENFSGIIAFGKYEVYYTKKQIKLLHIKLKGMGHIALCKYIVCPYTHPRPLG